MCAEEKKTCCGEAAPKNFFHKMLAENKDSGRGLLCQQMEPVFNGYLRKLCGEKVFELSTGHCIGNKCESIKVPEIVPCVHLRWGDGKNDHLETEDTEILCITVCNPYSNVQLHGVKLFLIVVNADGTTLANQADGTPSVQIKPDCMIGFGDIPPCDPQNHESQDSCVSREVVMINRGAKEGKYKIKVFYCFNACFSINNMLDEPQLAFDVELVRS